jgi:hypothetical protein
MRKRHKNYQLHLPPMSPSPTSPPDVRMPLSAPRRYSNSIVTFALDTAPLTVRPKSFRGFSTRKSHSQSFGYRSTRISGLTGQSRQARTSCLQEALRSHRCVLNPGGTLKIRPLQAFNLSEKTKSLYVSVRYRLEIRRTGKARPGVFPKWEPTDVNLLSVEVDPEETTQTIMVSVWSEYELQDVEAGRIEIPLGAIVDCCGDHGDYRRWFPLLKPSDLQTADGDSGKGLYPWTSEKDTFQEFEQEPCLLLSLRWDSHVSDSVPVPRTSTYLRAYFRELTVSFIDSYQPVELVSFTIRDIEARYVDSPTLTRASLVISWLQVDNQLPWAEAPIILGPTPVHIPQPLLQFSILRNKQKNQHRASENLYNLEWVVVLLQELDVRLEENFINALWQSLSRVLLDYIVTGLIDAEARISFIDHDYTEEVFAGVNSPNRIGLKNSFARPDSEGEDDADYVNKMLYIKHLELCPIKVS